VYEPGKIISFSSSTNAQHGLTAKHPKQNPINNNSTAFRTSITSGPFAGTFLTRAGNWAVADSFVDGDRGFQVGERTAAIQGVVREEL
jgi:hypothetical protein